VPALLEEKVAAGNLGRKTGRGFYEWKGNTPVLDD
jgi:3-hydroxyacyl-CoA dehydrogenase